MKIFAAPVSTQIPYDNYIKSVVNGIKINDRFRHVWGLKKNKKNLWDSISSGDLIFFYSKGNLISYSYVTGKDINEDVAKSLWGTFIEYHQISTWPMLIFLTKPIECKISIKTINNILEYNPKFVIQSFCKLNDRLLGYINSEYEDVEDFINKIK